MSAQPGDNHSKKLRLANLVLNYTCNNNCSFCFVSQNKQDSFLSLADVKDLEPFLHSLGRNTLNLVGGEPTLNMDFSKIVRYLTKNGYTVFVFSNGLLDDDLLLDLQLIESNDFYLCVNRSFADLHAGTKNLYRKLGHRIMLSCTCFEPAQALEHLFDEIEKYKLCREIRIGLAMPVIQGKSNKYLPTHLYNATSKHLFDFIIKGLNKGIRPKFDCGFPYCFFNEAQKNALQEYGIQFQSLCGIIPDICPDKTIIPCFPLHQIRYSLSTDKKWDGILGKMNDNSVLKNTSNFLFQKCTTCSETESGNCSGGCLALRLSNEPS